MLKKRAIMLRAIIVLVITVLVGRLVWVQGVKAEEITRRAEEMRLQKVTTPAVRGAILDRGGRVLAVSIPSYTIIAAPMLMDEKQEEEAVTELAPVLQMTPDALRKLLKENPDLGYLKLKEGLTLEQKQTVMDLELDGITAELHAERSYPQGALASQVIGYIDADKGVGAYGLEARYQQELAGVEGYVLGEFTQGQTPIESTIKKEVPAEPGKNITLSLDLNLQRIAEEKLDAVVKQYKAKRALAMAIDVHTGEILMMAMRPGADLAKRASWGEADVARMTNWAMSPLSPGSIFKTITTSAALEERAITTSTPFIDTGKMVLDGWTITNWDGSMPENPAPMTIAELLQRSSNIGLIQVGEKLGHEGFLKYLQAFGFMEPTGIDLSDENGANFGETPFDQKSRVDWANMFIGQHLEITPLQMLTAVAAIANGGQLVQPHLVRDVRDLDGNVAWTAPTETKRQVISETTAKEVQDLMVSVIEKGTASGAKPPGFTIGGKTGTAQKFENGKMKDRNLADFVGFAPANNPQVAMIIMVDEPEGAGYGGVVAAPIFRELLPQVMQAIGIAPNTDAAKGLQKATPKAKTSVVPDVTWLPVARAQERLTAAGFTPRTSGTGQVVAAQSLAPGSAAAAGTVVELTLAPKSETDLHVPDFTGLSLSEAGQVADEVGVILKASGSGFVSSQEPQKGTLLPLRSILSVHLAPNP